MKHSKKGVTLVELIICCGILGLLGLGCTTLLLSGHNAFSSGAKATESQMDLALVQNQLIKFVPSASSFTISPDESNVQSKGHYVSFQENEDGSKVFTVRNNGKDITAESIASFTYQIIRAAEAAPEATEPPAGATESTEPVENEDASQGYARAQFVYTVRTKDGSTFKGGFLLCNLAYDKLISQLEADAAVKGQEVNFLEVLDLKDYPVAFSIPTEAEEAPEET